MTPADDIRARQQASHRHLARQQAEADAAAADAAAHATDDHPHDAADDDDADDDAPGAPPSDALLKFRAEIDKAELRGAKILAELRAQLHLTAVRFDHIAQVARNGASILSDLADACDMPIQHDPTADEPAPIRTRYGMDQNRANEKAALAVAERAAAADGAADAEEP